MAKSGGWSLKQRNGLCLNNDKTDRIIENETSLEVIGVFLLERPAHATFVSKFQKGESGADYYLLLSTL